MINLALLLILVLFIIFIAVCFVGGAVLIFIDPIIAILIIWLIVKVIKKIKRKS